MVLRSALDGDVGHCKLALGTIPHRIDNGDPRDRCCVDGFRGGEGTGSTGKSRPKVVESGRDLLMRNLPLSKEMAINLPSFALR